MKLKKHIIILLLICFQFSAFGQDVLSIPKPKEDVLQKVMTNPTVSTVVGETFTTQYGKVSARNWGINKYIVLYFENDSVVIKEKNVRTNEFGFEDPETTKYSPRYKTKWTFIQSDQILLEQVQKDEAGENLFSSNILKYKNGNLYAKLVYFNEYKILKPTLSNPENYIIDFEFIFKPNNNIYAPQNIEQLEKLINDFEKRTTIQIAIVTLGSTFCDKEDFEDYTLRLANTWGIGQKGKDNGILIAISKEFRQIRIQNGIGIEKILSNEATKQIIENYFIPKFKENEYFEGTKNGLKQLMNTLENIKTE